MAKTQEQKEKETPPQTSERTFTKAEVEELLAKALQNNAQPSLSHQELARALVAGNKQVAEEAAVINAAAKSRSERVKEVEAKIAHLDDTETKPYMAYSTELYPHCAPTLAGQDFPKFILKRGGKFGNDIAAKKVVWLTDREAARVRELSNLKFAELDARDETGNPILDKRTNQPKKVRVPYSSFIRLVPTLTMAGGPAIDDPVELLTRLNNKVLTLEQELEEFKHGRGAPAVGTTKVTEQELAAVNQQLGKQKQEALLSEAEAQSRFGSDLPAPGRGR